MSVLERLRKERNLSREKLGAKAGMSARTIQELEINGRRPHQATINALSTVLDVDPEWLEQLMRHHRSMISSRERSPSATTGVGSA
jgi:transcriptional regulator with XRE-family HTH domain